MRRLFLLCFALMAVSLACAIATPSPTPQGKDAPSGSVLFQDDFSNPISGWDRLIADQGMMDYDGGGYRFLVNGLNVNLWSTPHKNFADVRIEVDSGKLAGPDENRIGLLCRFTGNDYYFFNITSDGFYTIGIFSDMKAVQLGQSEMQASESIHTGLAVNHLRADCVGDTLTFFVNGFQVAQAKDATLVSGDVGMIAGTFGQPGVDVVFDNFVVLKP
jgi:hypothetical protein